MPQGDILVTQTKPQTTHYAQTTAEFHRRQKSSIVVRHVSGDRIVAMIEIISPGNKNNTNAFYECGLTTQAYIETIAVGESLPDMPLFLAPESHILVPLEATYTAAWDTVPARWQRVIAPASSV